LGAANHPFWSVDQQRFVAASELRPGGHVHTRKLGVAVIAYIAPRPNEHRVYNLEVYGEHVYEVSALGLLVHNNYLGYYNGKTKQAAFADLLRAAGDDVVGEDFFVRTPGVGGGRREIDILVRRNGQLVGLEIKSGGATTKALQIAKDKFINTHGATLFGSAAQAARVDGQLVVTITTVFIP
jgi:hypothetical protein